AADEATHLFGASIVLGVIETCAGDARAAARSYGEAAQIAEQFGLRHATALRGFLNEAEAAAATGSLEQAEAAIARFDATVDGQPPPWCVPILHRARASILAARDDLRGAQRELELALDGPSEVPVE